jgi:hypothetical protein
MPRFDSTQEFNAYNLGLLAAMRARAGCALKLVYLDSQAERDAWQEGVAAGRAMRVCFDSTLPGKPPESTHRQHSAHAV